MPFWARGYSFSAAPPDCDYVPAFELKTVANNRLDDLNVAFLTGRRDHGQLFTAHCAGIANDTIVTADSVQLAQSA
jgi:hypothetical protein